MDKQEEAVLDAFLDDIEDDPECDNGELTLPPLNLGTSKPPDLDGLPVSSDVPDNLNAVHYWEPTFGRFPSEWGSLNELVLRASTSM